MAFMGHYIGGGGGSEFVFTGCKNGATLKKIRVTVGPSQVKSIQAWLSDGRSELFGKPSGNSSEFEFEDGERFTSLSLWGNGAGTRTGAIYFKTSKSREFFVKMTEWGLKTQYPIKIGSGICLGIEGRCGADIDQLAFIFFDTIKSTVLKDVKYPTLSSVKPQVVDEEIKSILQNASTVQQEYTIQTSKSLTKMSSWSVANKLELFLEFQVKAEVPEVVEESTGLSFSLGKEITSAIVSNEEKTEPLSYTVKVPPGKTMDVAITIGRVLVDLPYTGTVLVTCHNNATCEFQTKGIYKGVTFTKAKSEAVLIAFPVNLGKQA